MSRSEPGSAHPVKAVSVISTGTVRIRSEQVYGTPQPLYRWLLASRQWTPPRPINVYVIGHARGLIPFDTGQDRASVTDAGYFPGGSPAICLTGSSASPSARTTLTAPLGTLGYAAEDVDTAIVSHLHEDGLAPFSASLDAMRDGSMVLPTPGHTAGSMSLLVRCTGRPSLLLAGDLTYRTEILGGAAFPAWATGGGSRRARARSLHSPSSSRVRWCRPPTIRQPPGGCWTTDTGNRDGNLRQHLDDGFRRRPAD